VQPEIHLSDGKGTVRVAEPLELVVVERMLAHANLKCRRCGEAAARLGVRRRALNEIGDPPIFSVPRELQAIYCEHECGPYALIFNDYTTSLPVPGTASRPTLSWRPWWRVESLTERPTSAWGEIIRCSSWRSRLRGGRRHWRINACLRSPAVIRQRPVRPYP
jgi:hypothetical protein